MCLLNISHVYFASSQSKRPESIFSIIMYVSLLFPKRFLKEFNLNATSVKSVLIPPPKTKPVSKFITTPSGTVSLAFYMRPKRFSFLFMKIYIFCLADRLGSAHSPSKTDMGASR